jgi:hypothetical protein
LLGFLGTVPTQYFKYAEPKTGKIYYVPADFFQPTDGSSDPDEFLLGKLDE